jgi:N-acetylglucosaminyl-diphospho-decaprenol L-rhamnosyltransferase
MLLDRPHQPLEPPWLRKRIWVEERQPVAVRDSRRGDVVASGKPHVVAERDEFDPRHPRGDLTRTVGARVVDDHDPIGRPTLLRESGKRGSQVGAGIPIHDEHSNAHAIIIPRVHTTPGITVIIVNYNSGPHLAECLTSLDAGLAGFNWEVVVVDNASTDDSEAVAEKGQSRVRLVRLPTNTGFAAAANLGARKGAANLLLFMNPDCLVAPGFLDPLLDELDTCQRRAAVAPCVVNEDGSPQGNARGDPTMMTGLFGRSTLLSRLFPSARLARRNVLLPESQAAASVDWVSGSCVLVRREAFNEIGGFDERYFLYWEDADLCRRLRNAGWSIRFRPDARVVHVGARSSRTVKPLAIRAFHRSAYLYYATHVAPSWWSAYRWLAGGLLFARCGIKLLAARIR